MATQAERRKWRDAVERALNERDGAERYQLRQEEMRRGTGEDGARPPEFDARGFPIPQPIPSIVRRVGRLLREV